MKQVLVAVVGMSPAVLTETVWALAQQDPSAIPDEVVAITTLDGRERIRQMLFGEDAVWDHLRDTLGNAAADKLHFGSNASMQVIGDGSQDYSDITSPRENEQCADFILRVLRQYTEDSGTQVVASIAGGRKTMSALMLSCMSLLGREQDRICHVLVNDPFDKPLDPPFFFPDNLKHYYLDKDGARGGESVSGDEAQVQLSDVPFVCITKWQNLKYAPRSYSGLVHWINTGEFDFPMIHIDSDARTICVDGERKCRPGKISFGLLFFWLQWIGGPGVECESWADFREYLEDYFKHHPIDQLPHEWAGEFERKYFKEDGSFDLDDETLRKRMADARKKLEELFRFPELAQTLIPDLKGKASFSFPLKNIRWSESA